MELDSVHPVFRQIAINDTARREDRRTVWDVRPVVCYELDFISSSYGRIYTNGIVHDLRENDLFFRKPGQTAQGVMPYRYRYLTFDLEMAETDRARLHELPDWINMGEHSRAPLLLDEILHFSMQDSPAHRVRIQARILELLGLYLDACTRRQHHPYVQAAIELIERDFGETLTVERICRYIGISRAYLHELFRTDLGVTPMEYVTNVRLEQSRQMLIYSAEPVSEIALACGFNSMAYYSYVFKKKTGLSPTDFRRKYLFPMEG